MNTSLIPILFALNPSTWSIAEIAIAIVIIVGVITAMCIGVKAMGWTIPEWGKQLLWLLAIVFAVIIVIKLILMLW